MLLYEEYILYVIIYVRSFVIIYVLCECVYIPIYINMYVLYCIAMNDNISIPSKVNISGVQYRNMKIDRLLKLHWPQQIACVLASTIRDMTGLGVDMIHRVIVKVNYILYIYIDK